MKTPLTTDEQLEIANELETFHKIFYVFFELAGVYFSTEVPTACVRFPRVGKAEMLLGTEFWKNLQLEEKIFVVCHECLHVLLDHGVRNGQNIKGATPRLVNVAQDITINEMIVDLFGFNRKDLRDWKKFCWIDTCFENPMLIARNETFTYYLEKLIKDPPKATEDGGPSTIDEHQDTGDEGDVQEETQEEKKARDGVAKVLADELSPGELENLLKALPEPGMNTGKLAGFLEEILAKKLKPVKLKFSRLIRKLKKTSLKETEVDLETFARGDRRFDDLIMTSGVILPGKMASCKPINGRLLTAVFMDVSGSCITYLDVFQKVFLALDADRDTFDTRLFIFDTKVKKVKPGDRIYVGGGTSFKIIEEQCIELAAEVRYPDCVIIITDGAGDKVVPRAPTKWIWLLTDHYDLSQIPSESKHFLINQLIFDHDN